MKQQIAENKFQEDPPYQDYKSKLRQDCQPDSELEELAFERFAWASYQVTKARSYERIAEQKWLESPSDPGLTLTLERIVKLAILQERRANSALHELRQLQKDRFAAYEVHAELCAMGREVSIPKSLPTTELRKSNLQRTNPNYLAQFLLYQTQEVKDAAQAMQQASPTKPDDLKLSIEQLIQMAKDAGITH
ncbi:hypothetical protein [Bryobacter aggregatus]|uniref:hypothetical protein n=1 Tax=Bryobacter aggregatus TaxID=360054 RepID=UPI0004E1F307|nr:hypothetical protein [Bryobacter aggregatus]